MQMNPQLHYQVQQLAAANQLLLSSRKATSLRTAQPTAAAV
jgi:hypothetical protein